MLLGIPIDDASNLIPSADIQGDDDEDRQLLREMSTDVREYMQAFSWAPNIEEVYLAVGIGGVFALFLVAFSRPVDEGDKYLWAVTGDVPKAFFVLDRAKSFVEAIGVYCELMEDWANAVIVGEDLRDFFPVDAAPSVENAIDLKSRVNFIRETFIS